MSVSKDEVERIAALARLRLGDAEAERLAVDLSSILGHVEAMRKADISAVSAVGDMTEWPAPFRDADQGADPLLAPPESIAPEWREHFFIVPRLPGVERGGEESGA